MSLLHMGVARTDREWNEYAFEQEVSLVAAGNSDWVIVPAGVNSICVTLIPTPGTTAKVQTTTDTINVLTAGGETAMDWDKGTVTVNTQDACYPVTAIRLVQTTAGSSRLTLRAQ